jgi:hypothetical protein
MISCVILASSTVCSLLRAKRLPVFDRPFRRLDIRGQLADNSLEHRETLITQLLRSLPPNATLADLRRAYADLLELLRPMPSA